MTCCQMDVSAFSRLNIQMQTAKQFFEERLCLNYGVYLPQYSRQTLTLLDDPLKTQFLKSLQYTKQNYKRYLIGARKGVLKKNRERKRKNDPENLWKLVVDELLKDKYLSEVAELKPYNIWDCTNLDRMLTFVEKTSRRIRKEHS